MSSICFDKQHEFIDTTKLSVWTIKVFGIGSVGGELIKQLALTGFSNIKGYDYDVVERDNIGSQVFTRNEIGMKKTSAIQKIMKDWYDFDVMVFDGKITEKTEINPEPNAIFFCAFDSLEARKLLWDKLKQFPIIWGESRIGRTSQRYYFLNLISKDTSIKNYEDSLDPHGPRVELLCGEKGCFSSNAELVSKIVKNMVRIAEGKPFVTQYIGDWGMRPSIFVMSQEEIL